MLAKIHIVPRICEKQSREKLDRRSASKKPNICLNRHALPNIMIAKTTGK
jgi:hypothetical protein